VAIAATATTHIRGAIAAPQATPKVARHSAAASSLGGLPRQHERARSWTRPRGQRQVLQRPVVLGSSSCGGLTSTTTKAPRRACAATAPTPHTPPAVNMSAVSTAPAQTTQRPWLQLAAPRVSDRSFKWQAVACWCCRRCLRHTKGCYIDSRKGFASQPHGQTAGGKPRAALRHNTEPPAPLAGHTRASFMSTRRRQQHLTVVKFTMCTFAYKPWGRTARVLPLAAHHDNRVCGTTPTSPNHGQATSAPPA
jgi:hypothetical protein